jgi:hypothetical protein
MLSRKTRTKWKHYRTNELIANYKCNNICTGINSNEIIIIISLWISPLLGTGLAYGLHIKRTGHNPPHGPNAGWWVLTTTTAAGTNGLTCLPKHGGAQDNTFLVTHPMTDQRCLISVIVCRSAMTAGPSSSLWNYVIVKTKSVGV